MGLGSFLVSAGSFVFDGLKNTAEKSMEFEANAKKLKSDYVSYSDQDLMKKFKTSDGARKAAIGLVLKDRGFGNKK